MTSVTGVTWAELRGFALAGGCAYAVDLALFTWLRGPLGWDPFTAKALSFAAGCSVAYAGNALGTYRQQQRQRAAVRARARQYALFFAVNVAGALVQLLCLTASHHGLGLTSPRADTVSGAVVGMALATCLRFWGTRTLVFATEGRRTSWTG
ncbi:GtrA family protein [Streptomyces sp. ISL-96]|uniref:GtrA family protein n=1 Tax=Streptomyces sp. ISL-96 TaxID=2819191 RepID=UPI0027E2EDCB|nr:GtrA family protein [Streptomyces sp. ISL-96]